MGVGGVQVLLPPFQVLVASLEVAHGSREDCAIHLVLDALTKWMADLLPGVCYQGSLTVLGYSVITVLTKLRFPFYPGV